MTKEYATLHEMIKDVVRKAPMPGCAKYTLIVQSPAGVAVGEANAVIEVLRADAERDFEFTKGMLLHLSNQCRSVI
jgi:hypothetical protein